MFPAWWRHLIKLARGKGKLARHSTKNTPLPATRRPVVEQLEDRLVPTTLSMPLYPFNAVAPANGHGQQGGFVSVPILVDGLRDNSLGASQIGLGSSTFVFYYDTTVFRPLTQANIKLGVLPDDPNYSEANGWVVTLVPTPTQPPGYAYVTLTPPSSGNLTTTGGGSLVMLNFRVLPTAPLGPTFLDLAADTQGNLNPPLTTLGDGKDTGGGLPYRLGPTPNSNDALGLPPGNGPTDNTGDLQTISFSGSIDNGSTFELSYQGATTTPISYTSNVTLLQSNIQSALDSLSSIGPSNTLVIANSAASVGVIFQGTLGGGIRQSVLNWSSQLTGADAAVSVTDFGFSYYGLSNDPTYSDPTDGSVNIIAAAVQDHYVISGPATPVTAGSVFTFTVTAENSSNAIDTGYSGTVQFTSSDTAVSVGNGLPINATLTNGVGVFTATLKTAGSQTLTAVDTALSGITGTVPIAVNPGAASHFTVASPSTTTASNHFLFTVTALDQFNNTAIGYSGTIAFTSSDTGASTRLPANSILNNGVGTFGATLTTVGNQFLTATDKNTASITGSSGQITVNAAAATHFAVSAPAAATAATRITFTVTALDSFNNTVPGYSGVVVFSSSDGGASTRLPGNSTLSSGVGTFSSTLTTAGGQTLTSTDKSTSITGHSGTIVVSALAATHFTVAAPGAATAGVGFPLTVTALDQFNNLATGYAGSVVFSSSSAGSTMPASSTLNHGVGMFSSTLTALGSQTLTATDKSTASITGHCGAITTSAGAATHFSVSAPGNATAGTGFAFTVVALDAFNNVAMGYGGSISFSSSDIGVSTLLASNGTLNNGVGTFSVMLTTAGGQSLAVSDNTTTTIAGHSGTITVSALAATHFAVSKPASVTAGNAFSFTVTALDPFNNTATNYAGNVILSSSDASAGMPGSSSLAIGTRTFSATLTTAGSQTLIATDAVTSGITGQSGPITVSAAAATQFAIAASGAATAGSGFAITVTPLDRFNNTATGYAGSIVFASTDPGAILAGNSTLGSGVATFSATLTTAGSQTLIATDATAFTISGNSGPISVSAASTTHFAVVTAAAATAGSTLAFTVTALDPFNNVANGYAGNVEFSSSDAGSTNPANSMLSNGAAAFSATFATAGSQTLVANDAATRSIFGQSGPITVGAAPATHFIVAAPGAATAGSGFALTVTALDPFNNLAVGYAGNVAFSGSDPGTTVPAGNTLPNGSFVFSATLATAGSQTLIATDATTPSIAGQSGPITVSAAGATHFAVAQPTAVTAGSGFTITVTALDPFNNTATGYVGSVNFSSSDGGAGLPTSSPLTNGARTFSATLTTAGSQTLIATDATTASTAGQSGPITVSAGAATHFAVAQPTAVTAGSGFTITVTALDPFNNTATGYAGNVNFSSSDGGAGLPTSSPLTNGARTFSATLTTAGSQTLIATDATTPSIAGQSGPITVSAAGATHFAVAQPTAVTAGSGFTITVTALDPFNNTATGYAGSVNFSSSDGGAGLPTSSPLINGARAFSATLTTAGSQTLIATDATTASTAGQSGPITVSAGAATHFAVAQPTAVTAGSGFTITVTALDPFNNTATGYAGSVNFSSSDGGAGLPTSSPLTNGARTFSATLTTAGSQTLIATDASTSSIAGQSALIMVNAAAATHFAVVPPAAATAGGGFAFTLTALDAFNNAATGYAGNVNFSSTDGGAGLPTSSPLTNGARKFSATLTTAGSQTLIATDASTSSIAGQSALIMVNAATATHFAVVPPGAVTAGSGFAFTVTTLDAFNNMTAGYAGIVNFSSSDGGAGLPISGPLTNGARTFSATLTTAGSQTLIATDSTTTSIAGQSSPITVSAAAATHFAVVPPTAVTAGSGFTFTVTALDTFNNTATGYAGSVNFTSTDGGAGLPISSPLTNGAGTFSATLTTAGGQTLIATDAITSRIAGQSALIMVNAAAATHFTVVPPSAVTAGGGFAFTVTALDAFNNVAAGYAGSVNFSSSDGGAGLPTSSPLTNGTRPFSATLTTAGSQTLIATDASTSSIVGQSALIMVNAGAATHFAVVPPGVVTAGGGFAFTVTALDAFNNAATGYAGSVSFSSSDAGPVLPGTTTLSNGAGAFSATLTTAGSQTLFATDSIASIVTGLSANITVSAAAATHFTVAAPAAVTAGGSFLFTVTALDPFNNTAPGYGGTVIFSSTDVGESTLIPGAIGLNNGIGTFTASLSTAGNQTLFATDEITSNIAGQSPTITVNAAPATHFTVAAPGAITAGSDIEFTVTALDRFNNTAVSYAGTIVVVSSDAGANTPANSQLISGAAAFEATLTTAGSQTLVVTDASASSVSGQSGSITVSAGKASHFAIAAPSAAGAGTKFAFTVTSLDFFNNTAEGYVGNVVFFSSDGGATLPASSILNNGTQTFAATLTTAGNQSLMAVDATTSSVTGQSSTIVVSSEAATHFSLTVPEDTTAGAAFAFTVTAMDAFNNTALGYSGSVVFSSSDAGAILPATDTMANGTQTVNATLTMAGSQTLMATDAVASSISGQSGPISVSAGAATHFMVAPATTTTAGVGLAFTVTALDAFNNTANGYSGSVDFSSTDARATTPASCVLTGGQTAFSATLTTAGSQTLAVVDATTSSITGRSGSIAVLSGAATHFAVTSSESATAGVGFAFTVTALDQFNNTAVGYTGGVAFTSDDDGAKLPSIATVSGGRSTFSATLTTAGSQTLVAIDSATEGIRGQSSEITVGAAAATHLKVSTLATITAGNGFAFTVTALDQFNNTATGYGGTVIFFSTDIGESTLLPGGSELINGVGTFSATLTTAGSQTLTASDIATVGFLANSGPITVHAGAATNFAVNTPQTAASDTSFAFTVTALDAFNNIATGYAGILTFTPSDTAEGVSFPAPQSLSNGESAFSITLQTAGIQTIAVTDGTVTGSSATFVVGSAQATHFAIIGAPTVVVAGAPFTFTVIAETRFNTQAISYLGTVAFTSTDFAGSVRLPANSVLANGMGIFSAALTTAGIQALTATDTMTSTLAAGFTFRVSTAAVAHFGIVTSSATSTAGSPFVVVVIAQDQFNNTAAAYSGSIHFSSGDSQAGLPADGSLVSGIGYFATILKTVGNQAITASDTVSANIAGTSGIIAVNAAAATQFAVSAALPYYPGVTSGTHSFATTGDPVTLTVTALDPFGNTATSYAGTAHFASSDAAAALPSPKALINGVGVFTASFMTPGTQTLMATDKVSNMAGTSSGLAVRGLVVTSFTPNAGGFAITFNKPFDPSTVNLYTQVPETLPDDVMLATAGSQVSVRGTLVFTPPTNVGGLPSGGDSPSGFTFVKTDSVSATGAFNPLAGLLAAGKYTLTLRSYGTPSPATGPGGQGVSGFQDSLGGSLDGSNSGTPGSKFQITFQVSAPPVAIGIPDFARGPSNTDAIAFSSSVADGSTFALSYTNPAASPASGTATITFSANAATLQRNIQAAFTGGDLAAQIGTNSAAQNTPNAVVVVTNDNAAGANVLVTFQSALALATNQLLASSTPGVSIGLATINVANNIAGNGIPIALSSGQGVTSGSFTLQYNPNLLNIEGVTQSAALSTTAGASFTLISNTLVGSSGTAVFSLSSPSSIGSAAAPMTLGSILATVPMSAVASYDAKQLLHFSGELLNGTAGPIPVTNQDGVQVVAYLGDVTGTGGPFTIRDAADIAGVAGALANTAAQLIPGFDAFPNLDPAIIGDVSIQGAVNFTDANVMTQQVSGTDHPTIPYAPIGLVITPTGPDPTLMVSAGVWTTEGAHEEVTVPVVIDTARPQGSTGMVDAILALTFNPIVFDVSAADVRLGSVPAAGNGWHLATDVNDLSGVVGAELYSDNPILSSAGGSLLIITMHARESVPPGAPTPTSFDTSPLIAPLSIVPYVDPSGGLRIYQTQVSDTHGAFVLHTAAGTDLGSHLQLTESNDSDLKANPQKTAVFPPVLQPGDLWAKGAIEDVHNAAEDPLAIIHGTAQNLVLPAEIHIPPALLDRVYGEQDQLAQDDLPPNLDVTALRSPVEWPRDWLECTPLFPDIVDDLTSEGPVGKKECWASRKAEAI